MRVEKIFKSLSVEEISVIENATLLGSNVNISAIKLRKEGLKVVATNHNPDQAIMRYIMNPIN